ncbi:MAG: SH3 domain-containing protein [Chloroflexota bacterium]|nr:SH3 domain-containing protein [Chloroflexota bacterium]
MDIATSALLALAFFVYLLFQVLRKRSGHGWVDRLLGFVAVLVPTYAVYLAMLGGSASGDATSLLLVIGIGGVGLGAVLLVLERKLPGYRFFRSRGLLSAGVGILLIITLQTTPIMLSLMTGETMLPGAGLTETALAADATDGSMVISEGDFAALASAQAPLASPTPSPTAQSTQPLPPTTTFTPYPSATPMPTLPSLLLPTSTSGAMPALMTPGAAADVSPVAQAGTDAACQVTTGANLNMRQSPGTEETILATIPNGTTLTANATTSDRTWWRVSYDGRTGWVIRNYLYFSTACSSLP